MSHEPVMSNPDNCWRHFSVSVLHAERNMTINLTGEVAKHCMRSGILPAGQKLLCNLNGQPKGLQGGMRKF